MQTLLIPGFTQTVESWDAVAQALRDLGTQPRGCSIEECTTFSATADAMANVYGRGTWVGYSMGGRIALMVALSHAHLVEHLILVSATAGIESSNERATRRAADEELAQSAIDVGTEAFLLRWLAQPMFADVNTDAPGVSARASINPQRLAHDLRVLGTGSMPNLWDRLGELHMPVTIVTGARDAKFSAIGVRMHECIADSRHISVQCGHAILLERPGDLAKIIHDTHNAAARNSEETN